MPPFVKKPYWTSEDGSIKLYQGHAIQVLRSLLQKSVQCVVTSPPYWGLRDYGEGQEVLWEDGWFGAYGAEPTPQMFVDHTVLIFREVRRVLRDDGVLWLNFGDTYSGGKTGRDDNDAETRKNMDTYGNGGGVKLQAAGNTGVSRKTVGLPSGNLVGIPWRVALALQADGWVLRQDVIWHKPSPMPESVQNRCTKAHEYIFLMAKSDRYFYDAEAIKEPAVSSPGVKTQRHVAAEEYHAGDEKHRTKVGLTRVVMDGWKNKRSVWTVASQGYKGAHFATFPPKMIEPCVLAGTSSHGACVRCGSPFKRVVEKTKLLRERPNEYVKRTGEEGTGNSCANTVAGVDARTMGWEPTCRCGTDEARPCVVLDPFVGSGTTCCVAWKNGRHSVGIDLSEKYLRENAIQRVTEAMDRGRETVG